MRVSLYVGWHVGREAAYFNVTHEVVVEIGRVAAKAGIEMIVLDDGWFGERNDTTAGLGDWFPNRAKLPYSLDGLVRDVNNLGLKFGLWMEPEMVSMDSKLYKDHPDWCLHVPSRGRTTGRNQLVLDFSRECVRDHIYNEMDGILSGCNIEYVKWDMNRHLTEVFSQDFPAERQGEVAHRFLMGVYEVLGRITRQHPDVLFETCSGGGGRFDAGMLFFSPQIWTSVRWTRLVCVCLGWPFVVSRAVVSALLCHWRRQTWFPVVWCALTMSCYVHWTRGLTRTPSLDGTYVWWRACAFHVVCFCFCGAVFPLSPFTG